jgi:hypothetical protein
MVHSGYEATKVIEAFKNPFNVAKVALLGPRVEGLTAPEIPLEHQRPADFVFRKQVDEAMAKLAGSPTNQPTDCTFRSSLRPHFPKESK